MSFGPPVWNLISVEVDILDLNESSEGGSGTCVGLERCWIFYCANWWAWMISQKSGYIVSGAKQLSNSHFLHRFFWPRQGIKIQGEESESGSTSMREKMKQMAKTFGYGKSELGCQWLVFVQEQWLVKKALSHTTWRHTCINRHVYLSFTLATNDFSEMQKSHFRLTLKSPLGAVILLTGKLSQVSSLKLGQIIHGPLHVIHVYTSAYYSRYFQTYAKNNVLRAAPLHERCATLLSSLRHWIAPTFEFPAEWQLNTKQPVFFENGGKTIGMGSLNNQPH